MRRYAIFFIAIPVAALCVRLGFWQLSRLHQRRALNASARAAMALPPIRLEEKPDSVGPLRAVRVAGRFDFGRQVIVDALVIGGVPSVGVVTPLMVDDSTAVLVERGGVPSPDASTVALDSIREPDTAIVDGVVVAPAAAGRLPRSVQWPVHVRRPAPRSLQPAYPYRLLPYVVRRTDASPVEGLQPIPVPEITEGPHLGYAMQWFSFAVIALVGSVVLYRKADRRIDG